MEIAEMEVKVNIIGLKALGDFLDKYGDKVELVGSFEFKKGDVLFFKTDRPLNLAGFKGFEAYLKEVLPDVKVVLLDEVDLIGVGKTI